MDRRFGRVIGHRAALAGIADASVGEHLDAVHGVPQFARLGRTSNRWRHKKTPRPEHGNTRGGGRRVRRLAAEPERRFSAESSSLTHGGLSRNLLPRLMPIGSSPVTHRRKGRHGVYRTLKARDMSSEMLKSEMLNAEWNPTFSIQHSDFSICRPRKPATRDRFRLYNPF